jgi:DNA repair protein RadC
LEVSYEQLRLLDAPPPQIREVMDLPTAMLPATRLSHVGPRGLSDSEVLSLILNGRSTSDLLDLATRLLTECGGWLGLQRTSPVDLMRIGQMGPARIAQVVAALEAGRRLALSEVLARKQIKSPADVAPIFQADIGGEDREILAVLCVDTKNRVTHYERVYVGTVNCTNVRMSEIFRAAVQRNSPAIIVGHNHPSQDCSPSGEDITVTKQLMEAGQVVEIDVLDHLVVSATGYVSIREKMIS